MRVFSKLFNTLAGSIVAAMVTVGVASANDDFGFGFDRGSGWGNVSIKGLWACTQVIHFPTGDETDYFNHTFNADNTDMFSNTILNSQSSVGLGLQGDYGTVVHGRWKYIGFNKVQRRAIFLVNRKLDPGPPGVAPHIAGAPFARGLVDCICTLPDSNSMNVKGTFTLYAPGDLTFTTALAQVPFDATCKRVKFGDGSN